MILVFCDPQTVLFSILKIKILYLNLEVMLISLIHMNNTHPHTHIHTHSDIQTFTYIYRPFNEEELRLNGPQAIVCNEAKREVIVATKLIDRSFIFDKVHFLYV